MEIEVSYKGAYLIVGLAGELDQHMADTIRSRLDYGLLKKGVQNIIFDFTEVSFMDSSGIGMLLNRYKQVKRLGGKIYLIGCSKGILRIIRLSGLEKIVTLCETTDDIVGK